MVRRTALGFCALLVLGACASDADEPVASAAVTNPPADPSPTESQADPPADPSTDQPADPDADPSTDPAADPETDEDDVAPPPTPVADPMDVGFEGSTPEREFAEYDFSAVSPIVESFVAENDLNGAGLIVVHRDDGVLFHEHWGEFDDDRLSLIASSSKMITAGVLMHLDDQGLLDVDAPVADVVEWGAANPEVTTIQLLSNSSGLPGLSPDPTFGPYLCQFLATGTLQECAEAIFTTPEDDDRVVAPDTEFRYGGAQWQVAGAVAEAASGKSWGQLIDEIYVEPCGLEGLAYNNHFAQLPGGFEYPAGFDSDPTTLVATDNPNMEGGAYLTTGDYGKLLLMHLRGGVCGDTQVLSEEAIAIMHSDRIATAYDGDAGRADLGYGLGWWNDRDSGRLTDEGAFGSVPWLDVDDGYGAFLVIEKNSRLGQQLSRELFDVVESAVTGA